MAPENAPAVALKAATLKELKAACPGADEKFLCAQLEAEATAAAAAAAWMKLQADALKAANDELKALKAGKPGAKTPTGGKKGKKAKKEEEGDEGGDPDDEDEEDDDETDPEDAIESFDRLVSKAINRQIALGQAANRMKAVVAVANANPELHQAYLQAMNGSRRVKRMIADKFDDLKSLPK